MNQGSLSNSLHYFIFPGRPKVGSPAIEIHNLAFDFWMKSWTEVFQQNGVADKPNPDEFLRQDLISALVLGDKVIALHAYSFFDLTLNAARSHSYFSSFTPKAMENIARQGSRHVMTMGHFSVAPDFRKRAQGVSVAYTLLCLSTRIFTRSQADMWLTTARADNGAANMAYKMGCLQLDTGVMMHGTPCDLQGCPRGHERFVGGELELALADEMWNKRVELVPAYSEAAFPLKKVA